MTWEHWMMLGVIAAGFIWAQVERAAKFLFDHPLPSGGDETTPDRTAPGYRNDAVRYENSW